MLSIGKTPLIKLERINEPGCAEIYVKYEGRKDSGLKYCDEDLYR